MLRRVIISGAQKHGGHVAPLLWLIGVTMLLLLPIVKPRKTFIDENAVGHMHPLVELKAPLASDLNRNVRWEQRLVRGKRSPGSEVVAVYVNTEYDASVIVANLLIDALRDRDGLGCDVQFFFGDDHGEEWTVPQLYTRSALVLNVSSLSHPFLCIDFYGSNGIQPNQDLVNSAVQHALRDGFDVSLLCQKPDAPTHPNSRLKHYIYSLEDAIQVPLNPHKWQSVPLSSISTIAFSTQPGYSHAVTGRETTFAWRLAQLVLEEIISLNGLEERFHHSTFVWVSVDNYRYVEFDIAQFCIILYAASILSTGYCIYQRTGITLSPFVAVLAALPFIGSLAQQYGGDFGFAAASLAFALAVFPLPWTAFVVSINGVALCLLLIVQPATGLLAGAGSSLQILFLHPFFYGRLRLLIATGTAWCVYLFFARHLGIPLSGVGSFSEVFVNYCIYPNAVWVTSRLARRFLSRAPQDAVHIS